MVKPRLTRRHCPGTKPQHHSAAPPVQRPDATPHGQALDGGHEQTREVATRYAAPARTAKATTATGGCYPPEVPPANAEPLPMSTRAIKARLDAIEAALCPPVEWVVRWADDPIPPDDAPIITLHWPEDLQNSGAGASSSLGIPKPY